MKRLSMLLAGSVLVTSAHAVNWVEVTKSNSGSTFSLDVNSIEHSDINIIDEKNVENITVSMLKTYPTSKETQKEKGTDTGTTKEKSIHHSDQQLLISCKDFSYYKRAYVDYNADNKVLKSWQSEKPILTTKDFIITVPKSVGRTLIEYACKSYEDSKLS
ncbi:MAG: hypothetical protein L0G63_10300 [Psychrobacter sp.]|uniref:hypothetical protein n=1 Tax=Psychrobacter sp. TaxID=56811 RepID=UPI002648399D|nr:hypothetical protein [Psychrobacter sp.]MDN5620846.1 hypothetical protein [Psychrobacter sp.]